MPPCPPRSNSIFISTTTFTIPSLTHLDQYGYVTSVAYMRGTGAAVALAVIWALSSAALLYGDSHKEHTEATVARWNLLGHWNSAMTKKMQVIMCATGTRCFQIMKTTCSGIGIMAFDETIYRAVIEPFHSRVCDCCNQSLQWPSLTHHLSLLSIAAATPIQNVHKRWERRQKKSQEGSWMSQFFTTAAQRYRFVEATRHMLITGAIVVTYFWVCVSVWSLLETPLLLSLSPSLPLSLSLQRRPTLVSCSVFTSASSPSSSKPRIAARG
jgi:hypothetical protein